MKLRHFTTEGKKYLKEYGDVEQAWIDAIENYEDDTDLDWDDADKRTQEKYYAKALLNYGYKLTANGLVRGDDIVLGNTPSRYDYGEYESVDPKKESLKALARHVKEGVPLPDSLFRYQSEAYFDTFKQAKKLREAGALPELDWESEEMLSSDIGESVVLENGETVWLDVPYLEEDVIDENKAQAVSAFAKWAGGKGSVLMKKLLKGAGNVTGKKVSMGTAKKMVRGADSFGQFAGQAAGTAGEMKLFDLITAKFGEKEVVNSLRDQSGQNFNNLMTQGIQQGLIEPEEVQAAMEEGINENDNGMIGEPDPYYDAEERTEAYDDLQDALTGGWEDQYIEDGVCPNCAGTGYQDAEDEIWDEEEGEYVEGNECDGYGQYGCDEGEMQGAIWKEIMAFDQQNVDRQKAKDEYPGDEEVIKGLANMMKNMDDPRQAYQQMQADYPQMGRAQRSSLIAKAKQMAFPESVEIDQIKNLAGLNELRDNEDSRTNIEKVQDLLKDAIGSDHRGEDVYELYAELESMDSDKADEIKLLAKEIYDVRLEEGKSPHKKGTKKYKKHMAAMHAEARGRKLQYQGIADTVVGPSGKEYVFDKDKNMFISTDSGEPGGPEKVARNTPLGKKLFNKRKYRMSRLDSDINEAEYNGKKVKLNKPTRQSGGGKKYKVYVKNPKTGRVKKISFGDAGLKTKSGNKKRAKSFAARHNCEKKNDKMKAGYWACRLPRYGLVKGGKWW